MAATDPRTTIKSIVDVYLVGTPITKDDGVTPASTISLWEGGPETIKFLFDTALFDVIITFGDPRTRSSRPDQDVPTYFHMVYPIVVTTVDKYTAGVLVCTAARMQHTARLAIRAAIAGSAQSAPAGVPAYTLRIEEESSGHRWTGGIHIWESTYRATYQWI